MQQHCDGGDGGKKERATGGQQEREAPYGYEQQGAQSARYASAGVQNQHQTGDVDGRLTNGLEVSAQ